MLLTLDLGSSATKAIVWSDAGAVAMGRAEVSTLHPQPGWAEQDPEDWWTSVVAACAHARDADPTRWAAVSAVGFSAARETFVPVDANLHALGRGILWSDRRAGDEAIALAEQAGDVETLRRQTGVVVDAGCTAAKALWLAAHEPSRLRRARWVLAPRDLVAARMTGEIATDVTLASRTGFYSLDGEIVKETAAAVEHLLPPVRDPTAIAGGLRGEAADQLALPSGTPVVLGAGDRACEVLGTGASAAVPMVSWGTTTNVSVPVDTVPVPPPASISISRGALGGHLLEAGLSASGAAIGWLCNVTGRDLHGLTDAAAASPPGARGVVALPWLHGARAPWWRPGARAAFLGLTGAHGPGDLARAFYEAVAFDVARSLERLSADTAGFVALAAAGGGVASHLWIDLLAAVSGLPVVLRRSGEAGSVGAALVAAGATGLPLELERVNPTVARAEPDAVLVKRYRELRPLSDRAATGVLDLGLDEWSDEWR